MNPVASRRNLAASVTASALFGALAQPATAWPVSATSGADRGSIIVTDFGAAGDGTQDDAPAINRAFNEARRRNGTTETVNAGCHILFPAGAYAVHSSLNLTGLMGINTVIEGQGSLIIGRCPGQPVLDALGSRWLTIRDIRVLGDKTRMPSVGLQIGRLSELPGDNNYLSDVKIVGSFSFSCLYNRNSETSAFEHMLLRNDEEDGFCLVQDGLNHFGVTSQFGKTTLARDQSQSFNENLFFNCNFLHQARGTNVWLGDTERHEFIRCYSATRSGPAFIVYSGTAGHSMLEVDCHCETGEMVDVFEFDGLHRTATLTGFVFKDHYCFASRSVLSAAPGIEMIVLQNAKLQIPRFPNKNCVVFADPNLFRMTGSFYSTSPNCWNPVPVFRA